MGLLESLMSLLAPKTVSPLQEEPDIRMRFDAPTPTPTPMQAPTMPQEDQYNGGSIDPSVIAQGFQKFSATPPPVASMSSEIASAGEGLPDELLPAILALMETGGGKHMASKNNPYNLGPGIEYPDLKTAIVGGGPRDQKGFKGVIHGGLYDKYKESGKLEDFFNTFTPPGPEHGNPSMEELIQRYHSLRSLFQ